MASIWGRLHPVSAGKPREDLGRTFQTQAGARYVSQRPSFAIDRSTHAFQVSTDQGDALLVSLPEALAIGSLADQERAIARAPNVLCAREVGVLLDAEAGGASPYRGSAFGDRGRGYALFPARPVRTLASALGRARAGETFPPRIVLALALECAHGLSVTETLELLTPACVLVAHDGTAHVRGAVLEAIAAHARTSEEPEGPRWLGYLAPELLRTGARPTPAARLFALGVMLFELLAGRALFAGSPAAAAQQLARWRVSITDTVELGPAVPSELRSLVWSLLQREPDRRASPQLVVDLLSPLYEPDLDAGRLLAPDAGLSAMFAR